MAPSTVINGWAERNAPKQKQTTPQQVKLKDALKLFGVRFIRSTMNGDDGSTKKRDNQGQGQGQDGKKELNVRLA
jgi:hypothetical protein